MFEKDIYAGIIVLSFPDLVPIDRALVKSRTDFPYVPGLLSFREIPALMECFEQLKAKHAIPDVIMVDGQGIAHPRRLGIAAHFGLVAGVPTIGCAKSPLYGKYEDPILTRQVGDHAYIHDPKKPSDEIIGTALFSKKNSKPLIISPGNHVSVDEALDITRACLRGYRLPEPTRQAHNLVNAFRKSEVY